MLRAVHDREGQGAQSAALDPMELRSKASMRAFCTNPGKWRRAAVRRFGFSRRFGVPASAQAVAAPLRAPSSLNIARANVAADRLNDWELLPRNPDWASEWHNWWRPGEAGALARFDEFVAAGLCRLRAAARPPRSRCVIGLVAASAFRRDLPAPDLGPAVGRARRTGTKRAGIDKFLSELGWREFAYHLLFHFPKLPDENWRECFRRLPVARSQSRSGRLADGANRLSVRRCGHAPALADRLDAQSRAHGRGKLSGQTPAH